MNLFVRFISVILRIVYKIRVIKIVYFLIVRLRQIRWNVLLKKNGNNTFIWPYVVIHSPECVEIGDNVSIAEFVHIWGGGGVDIGNNVLIASHVAITSVTHDVTNSELYRNSIIQEKVIIGNNVWIGSHVVILPGVNIGEGSIIGAGSVVLNDVKKNSLVVGVPGRVIRQLNFDKSE